MPKFKKDHLNEEIMGKISKPQSMTFLSFIAILLFFRVFFLKFIKQKLDKFYSCITELYKSSEETLFDDDE